MSFTDFSDVVSHSVSGDLLLGSGMKLTTVPIDLLPKTSWWKLFIDKKHHKNANACLLFDRQQSKGFHAVMMRVFKAELGSCMALGERLDYAAYRRIYLAVSTDVGGIANRGPSGTDAPNGATHFPTDLIPSQGAINELVQEGVSYKNYTNGAQQVVPNAKVSLLVTGFGWRIYVGYKMAEGPALADILFDRYYNQMALAGGNARQQLFAIVRLIRALHVYHFFQDANGRLNTMVILNKLLTENGFPPSIVSNPAIFGGGRTLQQLFDDVRDGMRPVLREMEAQLRLGYLDLAT